MEEDEDNDYLIHIHFCAHILVWNGKETVKNYSLLVNETERLIYILILSQKKNAIHKGTLAHVYESRKC